DDGLVRVLLARKKSDDIVRGDRADVGVTGRTYGGLQIDGPEVAAFCRSLRLFEVQTGAAEQLDSHITLDPGLEWRVAARRVLADDVKLRDGVGILDRVPAVGSWLGLVNDHYACSTPPRCFLIFVGPAPV